MGSYLGFRPTKSGRYFFISYKRVDMERIAPIAAELDRMGIPLWYDEDIGYGAEWEAVLAEKIRNSLGVLLFVTQDTFEKTDTGINYVQLEYKVAKRNGKEIIPVFLEKVDAEQIPAEYSFWFEDLSGIQGVEVRNLPGTGENSAAQAIFRKLDPIYRGSENARTAAGFRSAGTAEGEPAGRKETEGAKESGFSNDHVTDSERAAAEENRRDFQEWRRRKEKKQRGVLFLAVMVICIGALIVFLVVHIAGKYSALPGNGDGDLSGAETSGVTSENALMPAEGDTGAGEAVPADDGSAAEGAADAPLSGDSLSTDSSVMEDNGSGENGSSGDASGTSDVSNPTDDSQGIQDASSAASAADTGAADSSDASASSSGASDGNGEDSQTQDNGSSDQAGESASTGGSQGTSSADTGSSGGTTDSAGAAGSGAAAGTSGSGNGTTGGNGSSSGTGSSGGSVSSAGNSSSGGTSDRTSDSSSGSSSTGASGGSSGTNDGSGASGSSSGNGDADSNIGNDTDATGTANG